MILCIANVLDAEGLAAAQALLRDGTFVDGAATAGWAARQVKNTTRLQSGPAAEALQRQVVAALKANLVFAAAVLPLRFIAPQFLRYGPGMSYGAHVDNALMGEGADRLRTDVSVTVFLSPPEEYDGGELVIDTTGGEEAYKLAAGSAVAYPSTTLHRVNEVTRGTRDVAVTWVQSFVRSVAHREVLFDLERVSRALLEREGKTAEFDLLNKTTANLRRMWAEP